MGRVEHDGDLHGVIAPQRIDGLGRPSPDVKINLVSFAKTGAFQSQRVEHLKIIHTVGQKEKSILFRILFLIGSDQPV